ncbi:hypothetical protein ACTXL0_07075 [Psychrobacter faecalis]|uniref:hypothetical protein n=1 Tax=Psychrobacter faecalis TaxID=180588 RepID=UPI003FD370A0
MNISDERAWEREFDRIEAKQKKVQPVIEAVDDQSIIRATFTHSFNHYAIKDNDNESNDQ